MDNDLAKYMLPPSYGAAGHRLSSAEELAPLLHNCLEEGGVHLIDAPVDYSENDLILNRKIPELAQAI